MKNNPFGFIPAPGMQPNGSGYTVAAHKSGKRHELGSYTRQTAITTALKCAIFGARVHVIDNETSAIILTL